MANLIIKKNIEIDGVYYEVGDEIFINDFDKIVKLNENGFIEPLTLKDIQNIKIEIQKEEQNEPSI